MNKFKIYKVKDENEGHHIKKDTIFDVPFRVLAVAKSQSGKTNLMVNILSRPEFYKNDFKPEDIYIISPSVKNDAKLKKLIKFLDIPSSNIFSEYSPELLEALYENIKEEFQEALNNDEKPRHSLIYMDDIAFDSEIKKSNIMSKLFMNSRHSLISLLFSSQKFSMVSTNVRENVSGMFIFPCSYKQLELINDDINYSTLPKKEFIKIFRNNTPKPYNFICINFSNDTDKMYLDSDFKSIKELNKNIK